MVGSSGCGIRHALGLAPDLWRMCIVNRMTAKEAARSLGLCKEQTTGVVRLLKSCEQLPSPERLAVTLMLDPGFDDEDVAEVFGRSLCWAAGVREQQDEVRSEEYLPAHLEWLEDGLQPGMPSPQEILAEAERLRGLRDKLFDNHIGSQSGIRCFPWDMSRYASFSRFAG